MPKLHDSGYKFLFSNRTIFRQLVETFVAQDWVKVADFDRAELIDKSFASEEYRNTESDLIYRLPVGKSSMYLYILLEFQSSVDRFMALRVLGYLVDFYRDFVKGRRRIKKLPPVFPIVLYNGEDKWTAATNMTSLIERADLCGMYGVQFQYFKIAENEIGRDRLFSIGNIVSTLFLAENHEDVERLSTELVSLFDREPDKQAVSLLINWFRQLAVHGRIEESDYEALTEVYRSREEAQTMLIKTLERDKQKKYEEGRQDQARRTALALLARGMVPPEIAEITGLSEEQVRELAERS